MNIILQDKILEFLQEDIGFGDITSDLLLERSVNAVAQIICREDTILAGLEEAKLIFELLDCNCLSMSNDGNKIEKNKVILEVEGKASSILLGERTALNMLGRMSGIATYTRLLIDEVIKIDPKIKIAATRKTIPGFRIFDKKAVSLGGGDTHRFRLDDSILIKDNHIRIFGAIGLAVEEAKKIASFTKKIEVEVSSLKEALAAVDGGADIIMLDNLACEEISNIVNKIQELGIRDRAIIEASGKINLKNIKDYACTGVDVISSGSITHSVKNIDFNLEICKLK